MLEYARWKYVLVGVVLLLALILALPNVFGEAPALQFARKDRAEITAQAQADVEKFLTDQKIPYDKAVNEKERLTVQFANVADTAAARDAVSGERVAVEELRDGACRSSAARRRSSASSA